MTKERDMLVRRSTGRIRASDGDDSRPHSPDKQAKAAPAGRCSKGQAEQLSTTRQQLEPTKGPQSPHGLPGSQQQQQKRVVDCPARGALVRRSTAAAVSLAKVKTIRAPARPVTTPAPSKAPMAAAHACASTAAGQLPAPRPLPSASVVSADDQLLLPVAVQQLQLPQQQQQQEQQQGQLSAGAVAAQDASEPACSCGQQDAGECASIDVTAEQPSTDPQGYFGDSACTQLQLDGSSCSSSDSCTVEAAAATAHATCAPVSGEANSTRGGGSAAHALLSSKSAVSEAVLSAGGSLTASEFEAITRGVAARIIQTHWHTHRQRSTRRWQQREQQRGQQEVVVQLQQEQQQEVTVDPQQQWQQQPDVPWQRLVESSIPEQPSPPHSPASAQQEATAAAETLLAAPAPATAAAAVAAAPTAGAALSKLRAAAGSRNASKLQHVMSAQNAPTPQHDVCSQQQEQEQSVCGGSAACSAPLLEAVSGATPYCGTGSGGQSGSAAAGPQQQQVQRHTSGGAGDKLSTILAYLDAVEASVQQDVGLLPSGLNRRPGTSCVPRTAGQCVSSASAARPHSAQHVMGSNSSSSSFALRQPTCPLLQPPSLQHQQQQPVLLWDGSVLCQDGGAGGVWQGAEHNAGMMAAAGSAAGGAEPQFFPPTHRPAVLAESVFDGVKAKMRNLKATLAAKEDTLQALAQEMEAMRGSHQHQLQQLAAKHQQQLAAVAAESSATLARHMGLIDRLMEEKGQLASKLEDAHRAAAAAEERHAAAVAALKQGWAAELKRQAANWEAAAAAKQEAWRTAKVAEIKEQTVKGLELEVQRLINRHRSELQAANDKAAEQVKAALEGAQVDHKAHMQALKDRWHQQQEEVLERERAAAAQRLAQANERWEGQLQALRMRLSAETDAKLEAAAAVVREEKRKGEAALEAAEARFDAREALLHEEAARQKEAMASAQTRALEAAKQAAADERTAWRAAITERLKHQAAEREDKHRAELLKQRDEQLEVVIRRLEAEGAAACEAAAEKVAAEHAAVLSLLQEQLRHSQEGAKRLAERGKAAAAAAAAAEREKLELQQGLEQTRKEMASQQQALAGAKAALASTDSKVSSAKAAAAAAAAGTVQQLQGDKARLEGRLLEAQEQLQQARRQHEVDMQHVELRVKAMVACKDEAIQQLQQQLAAALEALRGTEAVLAAQQEELRQV